jgi:two-component system cell cycle sensor histidine kinase/response regulator CckA
MTNQPDAKRPLQILHLEDEPGVCELVSAILQHAGVHAVVSHVHDLSSFERALREQKVDVVLADMVVAGVAEWAALEAFQRIGREIPFIFVSGSVDEQTAIEGLKRGATDYVSKSRLTRLPFTMNRGLIEAKNKASGRRAEKNRTALAAILESAIDFVATADARGAILYLNRAGREMIGAGIEEDLNGSSLFEFHPAGEGRAVAEAAFAGAAKAGQWRGESALRTRSGRLIPVSQVILAHKHPDGSIEYFSSVCRDLTESRRLEAILLRTQRLEGVGTLAGGIAHDLNNVLTPILMSVSMLRVEEKPAAVADFLNAIETNARRGADLVRQVLAFARGIEGQRGPVRLQPAIEELRKLLWETFPKSVVTEVQVAGDLWPVLANPTHIHQILLNLCLNSRDAMPSGGTLRLSARNVLIPPDGPLPPSARPGRYVRLTFADTGLGISPVNLPRVFDPFFTTKPLGQGTGLGLSTVSGIVRNYGGWIEVESRPEAGATFEVYLPALDDAPPSAAEPAPAAPARGLGQMILLVDDEQDLRRMAKAVLERNGYRVLPAANGLEGIAQFNAMRSEIKVILTDLAMPIMDGPEMVRRIRQDDPNIPVITMSGFKSARQEGELSAQANVTFLAKPFAPEDLLRRLDLALSAARPAAA